MLARVRSDSASASDLALLGAWKAGDQAAGKQLYRRHVDAVGRFFRNKVEARELADLMQMTFATCFEQSDRYRPVEGASFRAFLLGIARNLLLHHYRTRYRKDAKIDFDFGVSSIVEIGVSPSRILVAQEREQQLLEALRSLAIEDQILLELHYWEAMSGRELALLYEAPEGTIRTRLRRARELLLRAFTRTETHERATTATDLASWARQVRERFDEQAS